MRRQMNDENGEKARRPRVLSDIVVNEEESNEAFHAPPVAEQPPMDGGANNMLPCSSLSDVINALNESSTESESEPTSSTYRSTIDSNRAGRDFPVHRQTGEMGQLEGYGGVPEMRQGLSPDEITLRTVWTSGDSSGSSNEDNRAETDDTEHTAPHRVLDGASRSHIVSGRVFDGASRRHDIPGRVYELHYRRIEMPVPRVETYSQSAVPSTTVVTPTVELGHEIQLDLESASHDNQVNGVDVNGVEVNGDVANDADGDQIDEKECEKSGSDEVGGKQ